MVISYMLYILQHFNLNFIPFLIVYTVVLYKYYNIVQHFRLDYCENFELAWKETIDKLKWNMWICVVFENIIMFLVNICNHLVV